MLRHRILSAAAALGVCVVLQPAAIAQDTIEAVQVGPSFDSLLRPTTADASYRYYYSEAYSGSEVTSAPVLHQIRSHIGFRVLDTINSTFIFGVNRDATQQRLTQRRPRVWNEATLMQAGPAKLNAYAYIFFPHNGSATQSDFGLNPSVSHPIATPAGTVTLFATVRADGKFHSRNQDAIIENPADNVRSGLGLIAASEGSEENILPGGQTDPTYQVDTEAFVRFTPNVISDLTLAVGLQHDRHYLPRYTYDENNLSNRELNYELRSITVNRLRVDYKLTTAMTVTNDFYYQTSGFYQGRVDGSNYYGSRMINMTGVTYKFF